MTLIIHFARNMLDSVADAGENFLDLTKLRGTPDQKLIKLCEDLVSHKGVASGIALAREVVIRYNELNPKEQLAFFISLNQQIGPDLPAIKEVATAFINKPDELTLKQLRASIRSARLVLFNRMNMAPKGTQTVVDLRWGLLRLIPDHPELKAIDNDLRILLQTWFNPGFLELKQIGWNTEASILEKIIRYETVHNIENWDDLKQRLVAKRRCFAYFHPALEDDLLIFVEVALTKGIASSIQSIIDDEEKKENKFNTAIFYSINNCQRGLRGIPLGNFLIKMVVIELVREFPSIKTFSSLSPVTGFADWLAKTLADKNSELFEAERELFHLLKNPKWHENAKTSALLKNPLKRACAHYLLNEKKRGKPLNSVASFHFGNGAELYRINWMGNTSENGIADSFGLMVNYLYDLKHIETNHENYSRYGTLAISKSVKNLGA